MSSRPSYSVSTPSKKARTSKVVKAKPKPNFQPVKAFFRRQPFPKQLFNTLKYYERISFTLEANGRGGHNFSCNGLYDPNITGTGHQPLYFDQLAAIYNHYTVMKSRITFKLVNGGVTAVNTGVYVDDDTTPDIVYPQERNSSDKMMISYPGQGLCPANKGYWSATATFGGTPMSDPSLIGTVTSNPTEQSYFFCYVNGGTNNGSLTFEASVLIEYDVVWDELTTIASS